jgi:hypothetical protein
MWNGVHLSISPSASHSGYEDHFQSDQFHYLHHRFFECNYGTGDIPFDYMFGTFRDKMALNESSYKGHADIITEDDARVLDVKADLFGIPSGESLVYYGLLIPLYYLLIKKATNMSSTAKNPTVIAFLGSTGPVLIGILISILSSKKKKLKESSTVSFS